MATTQQAKEPAAVPLGSLLDAGAGAVVTLAAGETRLAAHRAVLAARSPVFAAMFGHDTLEASSGQVDIPDVEGAVLRQLVEYLYTRQLQAPQLLGMVPQLLAAADKYGVSGLKAACEQQVAAQLSVETAAAAAVLAVRHSCHSLTRAAVAFIKAHTHHVMATQGWADAVCTQPKDVVEVSRLLADPPAETSAPAPSASGTCTHAATQPHSGHSRHSRTPASAAPTVAASRRTPPADDVTVSRLRSLSAKEKARRLREAAKDGAVGELEALLAVGADVGTTDGDRRTALHWAADSGHVDAVRRLLCRGAQVDARTTWQLTPLHCAAGRGHAAAARLLLDSGADHGARSQCGRTPLHYAAFNGWAKVAAALLEAGADRAATDNRRQTPLDLAMEQNKQQLVDLLIAR